MIINMNDVCVNIIDLIYIFPFSTFVLYKQK